MIHATFFFIATSFIFQSGPAVRSGTLTQQAQSRDCALNIGNVAGNVTVQNCPGVPPRALEGLNQELRARRLSESQARTEAENWRRRYEELQASLASIGLTDDLLRKANAFLADGKLAEAAKVLDSALKRQDQQVLEAANTHYLRAKVAELEFQPKIQEQQLAVAYQLTPKSVIIANEYGNLLIRYGQPIKGEAIFKALVEDAATAKAVWLQAGALINMASALQLEGKLTEAKDTDLNAASLWELCYRNKCSGNSLSNESVAYSGAANIAVQQVHIEEARQLIDKSLSLALKAREEDGVSRDARDNTGLDYIISNAVSINIMAGNLETASSLIRDARAAASKYKHEEFQQQRSEGDLLVSECLIKARQRKPAEGLASCESALDVLKPLQDKKQGAYKADIAHALFITGLVQEDMLLWRDALDSFRQAASIWQELMRSGKPQFGIEFVKATFYSAGAAFKAGHLQEALSAEADAANSVIGISTAPAEFKRLVLTEAISIFSYAGNNDQASKFRAARALLPLE